MRALEGSHVRSNDIRGNLTQGRCRGDRDAAASASACCAPGRVPVGYYSIVFGGRLMDDGREWRTVVDTLSRKAPYQRVHRLYFPHNREIPTSC